MRENYLRYWKRLYGRNALWLLAGVGFLILSIGTALLMISTGNQAPNCSLLIPASLRVENRDAGDLVYTQQQPNKECVYLERVDTPGAREKGLGGRASMPMNQGMLFVFDVPGVQCFWMKDMRFALDMVWLDSDKKVIKIQPDVTPASYPKTFCSDARAQYVLEVNTGISHLAGVRLDQTLSF